MAVKCGLCPKACIINPGECGDCRIRINRNDRLTAVTYGFPCAVHRDPVEKKPLFHFLPGTWIFSLATAGCNLHCTNCQNWEISQASPLDVPAFRLEPEELPALVNQYECPSAAYTYTEPLVYYEYTLACSRQIKEAGLKNVLVTAGYLNPGPFKKLMQFTDAANIDLKAFSNEFYRNICDGSLQPVLDNLVLAKTAGVLVEVTNLLIPTLNDTDREMEALCRWIAGYMGKETPLHFSRFFPRYRLLNLPPTPPATLKRAREIALGTGLQHIYIGNIALDEGENTFCSRCRALIIRRSGYTILENHIQNSKCIYCGEEVYGIWK